MTKQLVDMLSGFVLLVCLGGKIAIRKVSPSFFNFKVNVSATINCLFFDSLCTVFAVCQQLLL